LARPLAVFAQDESAIRDVIAMAIANRVIKISALISEGGITPRTIALQGERINRGIFAAEH